MFAPFDFSAPKVTRRGKWRVCAALASVLDMIPADRSGSPRPARRASGRSDPPTRGQGRRDTPAPHTLETGESHGAILSPLRCACRR
jgi:hypothetical protein